MRQGVARATCSSCQAACHLRCTGIVRSRQLSSVDWVCERCSNEEPSSSSTLQNPSQTEDMNSAAQGSSQQSDTSQETRPRNDKCPHCNGRNRAVASPAVCCTCHKTYHKKQECTNTPRPTLDLLLRQGAWMCSRCQPGRSNDIPPHPTHIKSRVQPGQDRQHKLRFLQWNADGVNTKAAELLKFLKDKQVDIAFIQETRLRPQDRTPAFPGFNVCRKDRPAITGNDGGGGLLTLVKTGLAYNELGVSENVMPGDKNLEMQGLEIILSRRARMKVFNVYAPST